MSRSIRYLPLAACIALMGCGSGSEPSSTSSRADAAAEAAPAAPAASRSQAKASMDDMEMEEDAAMPMMDERGGSDGRMKLGAKKAKTKEESSEPEGEAKDGDAGGERTREWFPESFLWQPLVETGPNGVATLDVRVPDQLTTWRVLGLGVSRDGQQAGDVLSFDTRMDVFVEPVPPGWLYAGDRLDFPVQVVNSTSKATRASLTLTTEGALTGSATGSVEVSAGGSRVWTVPLQTRGAGPATVEARLPGLDAARRSIVVHPAGRPHQAVRGGTLASARAFSLPSPPGIDASTQRLEVQVFPGPLAVVQAEVERAQRGRAATAGDAAYSFALADALSSLAGRSGADLDADEVRKLQMRGWQRVARHATSPSPSTARDLLLALHQSSDHALAEDLKRALVRQIVDAQRGDGTWQSESRSDIQRTLVETALTARVLPEDEVGARLRAAGALERHATRVTDPYTAAVVLASGLVEGAQAERLRALVDGGLLTDAVGARDVAVPSKVRNAWGGRPTLAEMRAVTFLAAPQADWAGDVLSGLLAGWGGQTGFGAGAADVLALEAIVTGLPPLTSSVDVILALDGKEVARQTLDPSQPRDPAFLTVSPAGATGAITLRAEPEVPGLAFVSTLRSWTAWKGTEGIAGVDLEVKAEGLRVGQPGTLRLTVAAPSGTVVAIDQGLPAGVEIDERRLASLPGLTLAEARFDHVHLETKAFGAGEILTIDVPVRPSFAGTFATRPLSVSVPGRQATAMAPLVWTVAP